VTAANSREKPPGATAVGNGAYDDEGLSCLVLALRFLDNLTDPEQLRHEFTDGSRPLDSIGNLRAAKRHQRGHGVRVRTQAAISMPHETSDKVGTIAQRLGFYDGSPLAATLRRRGLGRPTDFRLNVGS